MAEERSIDWSTAEVEPLNPGTVDEEYQLRVALDEPPTQRWRLVFERRVAQRTREARGIVGWQSIDISSKWIFVERLRAGSKDVVRDELKELVASVNAQMPELERQREESVRRSAELEAEQTKTAGELADFFRGDAGG